MKRKNKRYLAPAAVLAFLIFLLGGSYTAAQGEAKLFFAPKQGSFVVGSTFEVSILLDTGGSPINVVEAKITFPADKLQVVSPSTGSSLISLWIQQPTYSNKNGTISFIGGIPERGVTTSSGLISTITFRVIKPGSVVLKFDSSSKVLAADGLGSNVLETLGKATYNLIPKPPDGPKILSPSHPDSEMWYRNNNVIFEWEADTTIDQPAFSYSFSKEPSEIPDNIDDTNNVSVSFPNVEEGVWYFHLKQKLFGIYGEASHFEIKIDTTPPAEFKPNLQVLTAAILTGKAFVSFLTTDSMSGMDHYEIAVFDTSKDAGESPRFIEAESPYSVSWTGTGSLRVVVRAFDKAGNMRDGIVDVDGLDSFLQIIKKNYLFLLTILLILSFIFIGHLFSHHKKRDLINLNQPINPQ